MPALRNHSQPNFTLQGTRKRIKPQVGRWKEIANIRAEIETKKTINQ